MLLAITIEGTHIMEFSDTEKKMVAVLRRKQVMMQRWRWGIVFVGILCLGASGYGLALLVRFNREPDLTSVLIVASFLPQIYVCMFIGTGLIFHAWTNWNGNPQERLLLRLIDEKLDNGGKRQAYDSHDK
jgi:hypothetical protein